MGGIIQLVYVMLSNKSFYVYLALGHGASILLPCHSLRTSAFTFYKSHCRTFSKSAKCPGLPT